MSNGQIDYRILEEAYPELMRDEFTRMALARAFGIQFTDKVSLEYGKYGWHVTEFIDKIFKLFENEEFRSRVTSLLRSEYPQGIPNLAEEWVEVRLKGLASEPTYGKIAIKLLKEIMRVGRARLEELERILSINRGILIELLKLLDLYKLIIKDYNENYRPAEDLRKYSAILERLEGVGT